MGVQKNISADMMPKQGSDLGQRVRVCFGFDTSRFVGGRCIRDDVEAPFITIFALDDERVVLATECQYQLEKNVVKTS